MKIRPNVGIFHILTQSGAQVLKSEPKLENSSQNQKNNTSASIQLHILPITLTNNWHQSEDKNQLFESYFQASWLVNILFYTPMTCFQALHKASKTTLVQSALVNLSWVLGEKKNWKWSAMIVLCARIGHVSIRLTHIASKKSSYWPRKFLPSYLYVVAPVWWRNHMEVKLIARPRNPLNVITNQKLGNLKSGLQTSIFQRVQLSWKIWLLCIKHKV